MFFIVFVISLPTKLKFTMYLFAIQLLICIIYGDNYRFCRFANLLNRPTNGATVSVRKRAIFRPLVTEITVFIKDAQKYIFSLNVKILTSFEFVLVIL
jgi:hypothetical protein